MEVSLVVLCAPLFVYSVADWLRLFPWEPFRPLQMMLLSGALLLQPIATLMRPRSTPLFGLTLVSAAMVVASFFVST